MNIAKARLFAIPLLAAFTLSPAVPLSLTPLPLRDLSGTAAVLDNLGLNGTWVVVYLQPQCKPCTQQLQLLRTVTDAGYASRIVIIGGGMTAREAQSQQRSVPHLAQARWYTDLSRAVPRSLHLRGAPVILGIRGKRVEWTLNGVPPKPDLLKNSVISWMRTR